MWREPNGMFKLKLKACTSREGKIIAKAGKSNLGLPSFSSLSLLQECADAEARRIQEMLSTLVPSLPLLRSQTARTGEKNRCATWLPPLSAFFLPTGEGQGGGRATGTDRH